MFFYILSIQATPFAISEGTSTVVLFSPPIIYRSFSKSSLAPAAIRRNQPIQQSKSHKSSLRPHVWGFFFHLKKVLKYAPLKTELFSSPCLGILFSHKFPHQSGKHHNGVFVPMFGDSFFTGDARLIKDADGVAFSSPCLGILFSRLSRLPQRLKSRLVFVPMFGDSFFTVLPAFVGKAVSTVFVPMFGDSFFTAGLGCPTGWALYGPFAAGISN